MDIDNHYRSLENQNAISRKDDILRASLSAFVILPHPSTQEIHQTLDLALSILPYTSASTKRFAAAILASSIHAPLQLVRRLCEEDVEVCAPLLLKSPIFSTHDLIEMIKISTAHAQIIAKRDHLPIAVLEALASEKGEAIVLAVTPEAHDTEDYLSFMENFDKGAMPLKNETIPQKLLRFALSDQNALFITLMADLSKLSFMRVEKIARRSSPSELSTLLKAFHVESNSAFVICSIFYPRIASHRSEIQLFLTRYQNMETHNAQEMIEVWKLDEADTVSDPEIPANQQFDAFKNYA